MRYQLYVAEKKRSLAKIIVPYKVTRYLIFIVCLTELGSRSTSRPCRLVDCWTIVPAQSIRSYHVVTVSRRSSPTVITRPDDNDGRSYAFLGGVRPLVRVSTRSLRCQVSSEEYIICRMMRVPSLHLQAPS